jgi:hypothetical protein
MDIMYVLLAIVDYSSTGATYLAPGSSLLQLVVYYSLVIVLHACIGLAFSGCVGNLIVIVIVLLTIA